MSDAPIVGTHREPSEEPEPDGLVLFDPTPRPDHEDLEEPKEQAARLRLGLAVLLVVVLFGGSYQMFQARSEAEPSESIVPVLPPLPPVDSVAPASLTALGGSPRGGTVGTALELEVLATGPAGVPMGDTLVLFEVVEGEAEIQTAGRTGADGVATALLRLPVLVGEIVVVASLSASDLRSRIVVEVGPGPPTRLEAVEGRDQMAEVEELLPVRPSVRVVDAAGNVVPGADVRFSVMAGQGQVAPSRTRTDSLGLASALWRLGRVSGPQELLASSIDVESEVTFVATALGRPTVARDGSIRADPTPVTVERRSFAVGGSHACALEGGALACRGANDRGQSGATERGSLVALASGISHTCGLDGSGFAFCWGANEGGQLGDGSRTDRNSPNPVRSDLRFISLTAGASHTCGVAGGGLSVCWGENLSGQLGDGSRTDARFPRAVGGGLSLGSIVAGWSHTCGVTVNGNAFCWGLNSDGQLGDGSRLDRLVPTLVRGDVQSLTAGSSHTCGISGGNVFCWGDNRFGQLGDGTVEGRVTPTPVIGLPGPARQVVSGAVHTCALLQDGSVYCWGQNLHGQLGDGSTENRSRASLVAGGLTFRSIEAGGALTCGFSVAGAEYCWGLNQNGQLGDGTRQSRSTPTPVQR